MTTSRKLLLGIFFFTTTTWAQSPHFTQALKQTQAAQSSCRVKATEEASAHTRAALGHVEIMRREYKSDKNLKSAEANLALSLEQNKNQAYDKSANTLEFATKNLLQFNPLKH